MPAFDGEKINTNTFDYIPNDNYLQLNETDEIMYALDFYFLSPIGMTLAFVFIIILNKEIKLFKKEDNMDCFFFNVGNLCR